jgi:hypothetical protein
LPVWFAAGRRGLRNEAEFLICIFALGFRPEGEVFLCQENNPLNKPAFFRSVERERRAVERRGFFPLALLAAGFFAGERRVFDLVFFAVVVFRLAAIAVSVAGS